MMPRSFSVLACLIISGGVLALDTPSVSYPCGGVPVDPANQNFAYLVSPNPSPIYYLQISLEPTFSPFDPGYGSQSPNIPLPALQYESHYYLRARASDGTTFTPWSETCEFFTGIAASTPAPVPDQPLNGASGLATSINFSWTSIPATGWDLQLSTSPSFTNVIQHYPPTTTWTVSGLVAGQTYYWRVRRATPGGSGTWSVTWSFNTLSAATSAVLRVNLQGPWNTTTNRMSDGLRSAGLIPSTEPYSALGYTGISNAGVALTPSLLSATGANAVVDWILVEARHATTSAILARWALLLQSDGDVMMPNGAAPSLVFPTGQFRIAFRHRTHLGAMASSLYTANGSTLTADLTLPGTPCYGTEPTTTVSGKRALWCGDVDLNGSVIYVGANNDRDPILSRVGGSVPTNTVTGTYQEDVNMDGVVRYVGAGNDRDPLLATVGGSVPTATRTAQLP